MRMTTRSSRWITIQALTSVAGVPTAAETRGNLNCNARPPPTAVETLRNSRRERAIVMIRLLGLLHCGLVAALGERMDRLAHARIRAATAEIRDAGVDVGIGRLRILRKQRGG